MSSYIRNAGRNLHKAHLKHKIARIEEEQAMAEHTTTDEVIDVVADTVREGVQSLRHWGSRVRSSLATYVEEEKAQQRRADFKVIDGRGGKPYNHEDETDPRIVDEVIRPMSRFSPTLIVTRSVAASSYDEAAERMVDDLIKTGYEIVRHPSVS